VADVVANGVRFHVQQLAPPPSDGRSSVPGPRPTVVFIHGLIMDNLSSFYYTLANTCASGGENVMLYDLRGHGLSERPPSGYTLEDSVDDLVALLSALGIDGPVHLVGNSYGGTIGLAFALAYPERVASLILIEAHFAVSGWAEGMARTLRTIADGMEMEFQQAMITAAGRKMIRMAKKAEALINHTSLVPDLLSIIPLAREPLATITCPVLAIYGEESDVIERAHELDLALPDFTLDILPGCDHSILMEVPSHLQAVLAWWLAGHVGAPPAFQPPPDHRSSDGHRQAALVG
jgi:pimeloyl-ACP methyl ester carboxylesterase